MNLDTFRELHEALGRELARCEMEHASRMLLNQEQGKLYWPTPWLDEMSKHPELEHDMELLIPLPEEHLSPMTPELRSLAAKCGLPEYKGRSKPNPPPRAGDAKSRGTRQRCPKCGEWLIDSGILARKRGDFLAQHSGEMVCKNSC